MIQIPDQVRLALGDTASNSLAEIDQIAMIIFNHMREVHRLRLEFCGGAVDRHSAESGPVALAVMCGVDAEYSESMKLLAHRLQKVGEMIEDKAKDLAEGLLDVSIRVGSLEGELRRVQARVKEHATNAPGVREEIFNSTGGLCFYCEVPLWDAMFGPAEGMDPARMLNIDHIVPKTHGGPDHISNYVPSCAKCNMSKSDRPFLEFVKKRSINLRVINGGAA